MNFLKKNLPSYVVYGFFTILFLINFYVCDDAFISFRSWENLLLEGVFSYNVDERVQAFTNVLWTILSGILKYLIYGKTTDPNNYWNVSFILSFTFSIFTIIVINREVSRIYSNKILPVVLCFTILFTSKAFIDFTSSGLEYPLAYFVVTLFFINYYSETAYTGSRIFWSSLLIGLSYLSRTDSVILLFCPYLYILYRCISVIGYKCCLKNSLLGLSPLLAWLIFQIFYYGFLFPNTAYGKLGSGSNEVIIQSGFNYLLNTLVEDPTTIATLFFSCICVFFGNVKFRLPLVSILISIIYVIKTGGDFMGGRFFVIPFVSAVLYLVYSKRLDLNKRYFAAILIAFMVVIQLLLPISTFNAPLVPQLFGGRIFSPINFWNEKFGISVRLQNSDKYYYYPGSALMYKWVEFSNGNVALADKKFPFNGYHAIASRDNCLTLRLNEVVYEATGGGGLLPFCRGPNNIVIGKLALSDPLLARLNYANPAVFLPGHNVRNLPAGYLESRKASKNLIEDKNVAAYYDKIYTVVSRSEDLFGLNRIKNIFYLNIVEPKYVDAYH